MDYYPYANRPTFWAEARDTIRIAALLIFVIWAGVQAAFETDRILHADEYPVEVSE